MAVQLEIQDGVPNWWLSPNIWTTADNNPSPSPSIQPLVGHSYNVWARVRNNGSSPVKDAQVYFYWANPGVGFDRNSATLIGSSNVPFIAPGQTIDVKCTTLWTPIVENGGHECLLVEVFHPSADPLPATVTFNTPTDRHVAQRNLCVIIVKKITFVEIMATNRSHKEHAFRIYSKPGKLEELKPLEKHFSSIKIPFQAKGKIEHAGFVMGHNPNQQTRTAAKPVIESFPVKGNATKSLSFVGQLNGEAALVHILQEIDGKIIGGLSILMLSEKVNQS